MSYYPKTTHERILHRLKISAGQLAKVIKMAESRHYCIDIIHQSQAVQKALREADQLLLENHLKSCVAKSIGLGRGKKVIKEIMEVIRHGKK